MKGQNSYPCFLAVSVCPVDNCDQSFTRHDIVKSDLWHTGSSRYIGLSDLGSDAGTLCSYSQLLDTGRSVSSSLSCGREDLSDMYYVRAECRVAQVAASWNDG